MISCAVCRCCEHYVLLLKRSPIRVFATILPPTICQQDTLLPCVQAIRADLAGKITGMLLEMDNSELLLLLESPEALEAKVEEAIDVCTPTPTRQNFLFQACINPTHWC